MSGGELAPAEPHPAAHEAKAWIAKQPPEELHRWREAFASCAIEGNRLGEVCAETLNRLLNSQPVSDRYLLGLVLTMRSGNWPNAKEFSASNTSVIDYKIAKNRLNWAEEFLRDISEICAHAGTDKECREQVAKLSNDYLATIPDDYPQWICSSCGAKYGKRIMTRDRVSSWHAGTCDVCGIEASITEPRDFGHLQEGWRKERKEKV